MQLDILCKQTSIMIQKLYIAMLYPESVRLKLKG